MFCLNECNMYATTRHSFIMISCKSFCLNQFYLFYGCNKYSTARTYSNPGYCNQICRICNQLTNHGSSYYLRHRIIEFTDTLYYAVSAFHSLICFSEGRNTVSIPKAGRNPQTTMINLSPITSARPPNAIAPKAAIPKERPNT